ncbi:MAG: response regulator [Candidatus Omnitrophica bacterium]|nr:response regulator [Candidatus Omnitrophota bacterium]
MIATRAKNILIVEDDQPIAEELVHTLRKMGHGITAVFATGEEALENMTRPPCPDLVIMDVNLAGTLDGIEAGERMESQFKLPVIYITGYPDKVSLLQKNGKFPLVKPFTSEKFKSVIDVICYRISAADIDRKESISRDQIPNPNKNKIPT